MSQELKWWEVGKKYAENTPVNPVNPYGTDTLGGRITNRLLDFGAKVDNTLAPSGGPTSGTVAIDQAKLDTFTKLGSGTQGGGLPDWAQQALALPDTSTLFDERQPDKITYGDETAGELTTRLVEESGGRGNLVPGDTTRTETGSSTETGSTETGPKKGDLKEGPDGQILRFNGTAWEVVSNRTTREVITEDPSQTLTDKPAPGADADMSVDRYLESLGTDTLAGQAYNQALARRMATIDEQQLSAGRSYGDMYEQAKMSQARRRGLSDTSGMTGGMEDQMGARISAAEMGALGQIGMGRDQTVRGLELSKLDAPMAAFEEGRQIEAYERSKTMMDREMQQSQTLFDQAQSGWMQNEDGTWTNMDKEMQDSISLQAINAQQRAEVLGEMQYWQSVLLDTSNMSQAQVDEARSALGTLQTRYGTLLTNSSAITGRPNTPGGTDTNLETDTNLKTDTDLETDTEPKGLTIPTGTNTTIAANNYVKDNLTAMNIGDFSLDNPSTKIIRSTIRNQEELAKKIVNMAGDNVAPGYTFENEIAIVGQLMESPTTLSTDQFNQLKEAGILNSTSLYYGLWNWTDTPVKYGRIGTDVTRFTFPDTPENREVLQYLMDEKGLPEKHFILKNGQYELEYQKQALPWKSNKTIVADQFEDYFNSKATG